MKMPGVSLTAVARPIATPPSAAAARHATTADPRDEQHQQRVDLAEIDRLPHRFERRDQPHSATASANHRVHPRGGRSDRPATTAPRRW